MDFELVPAIFTFYSELLHSRPGGPHRPKYKNMSHSSYAKATTTPPNMLASPHMHAGSPCAALRAVVSPVWEILGDYDSYTTGSAELQRKLQVGGAGLCVACSSTQGLAGG